MNCFIFPHSFFFLLVALLIYEDPLFPPHKHKENAVNSSYRSYLEHLKETRELLAELLGQVPALRARLGSPPEETSAGYGFLPHLIERIETTGDAEL
ncbi:MAG: hypothetical protein HY645_07505 [Acidobacteria bacterium]|nr:hypothetical protein [Acidobacteriota bacterium]